MGLFDFFMSDEKRIVRAMRKLTNRDAQPEDRDASAAWLADKGTPEAILALLARFDLKLDHQLKDAGEKESVYALIRQMGPRAIEPTKVWLRQCKNLSHPLKLFVDVAGEDAAIDLAGALLRLEIERDDFKPEKKKALLAWMSDRRDERCVESALLFLDDFDEGVRYVAAEALIAQRDDRVRGPLWSVLISPKEESNRLKVRIADEFVSRRWPLGEADGPVRLPEGFALGEGVIVRTA